MYGLVLAALLALGMPAFAADIVSPTKKKSQSVPILGPGSDKLSPEEYIKVYRTYIQQSMLLGYPFMEEAPSACEQSLRTLFRQAGMFTYPVPEALDRVERAKKIVATHLVESYLLGGQLLQVERDNKSQALLRVLWVNSSSPKAVKYLWNTAKLGFLQLERDPNTGLERLQKVPVGYPHPYLDVSAQGLFVRELKFNGRLETCSPVGFDDNAWTSGFALTDQRCGDLRSDIDLVWQGKLKAGDFAEKERQRLKDTALKSALARGLKKDDAEKLINQSFVAPFNMDVTVVGGAMRNLSQCNLLAIGGKAPALPNGAPPATSSGASGVQGGSVK